jgi:3-oxoacyl-[acyl-carrier-protein] synthase-1
MSLLPVHIAGTGLACALGDGLPAALAALRGGGVRPQPVRISPEVQWPVYRLAPGEGDWRARLVRTVRAVAAEAGVADAMRDAPLFVASSSLDIGEMEQLPQAARFGGDLGDFADIVARALDWRGPVFTVSTACTSAFNAVLSACDMLRAGEAAEALVIGAELGNRFTVAGFGAMQLLSPDAARPFGAARNGLVLGEAVAALRLTRAPAGRWRVAGGANVVDGRNPSGAEAGAVRAMCEGALAQAGLASADVDLVKVQAAGGPANDAIEAEALKQLFGTLPPLVSLKAQIGHALGASGAAELALLLACIEAGAWPRADYELDAGLGVALAAEAPARLRHLLFNLVGFGGGHAALLLAGDAA